MRAGSPDEAREFRLDCIGQAPAHINNSGHHWPYAARRLVLHAHLRHSWQQRALKRLTDCQFLTYFDEPWPRAFREHTGRTYGGMM